MSSLLRASDYFDNNNRSPNNVYWNELIKAIDEFDELIQMEKKEILSCLKQHQIRRIQLTQKFHEFKQSLRFEGEVAKKDLQFVEMDQFSSFFQGYHNDILAIIEQIVLQPQRLANLFKNYKDSKKWRFGDFLQNLAFNIYPCFLPESMFIDDEDTNSLAFIEAIIFAWPYSIQSARPSHYTILQEVITGYMKTPTIVCFIEKIAGRFLQEIAGCRMDIFAFDQQAIRNELQIKKHHTFSESVAPKKPSWKERLKSKLFRKTDEKEQPNQSFLTNQSYQTIDRQNQPEHSFITDQSDDNTFTINDMMKKRQSSFLDLIQHTVESILSEKVPTLLCTMFQILNRKINLEISARRQHESLKSSNDTQRSQQRENETATTSSNSHKGAHYNEQSLSSIQMKHYCYFLMTNLIFAELHRKFTISHEEVGMTHADLQNISQILRILSCIFQGVLPEGSKYRNIASSFTDYKAHVESYYTRILSCETVSAKELVVESEKQSELTNENQQLRSILMSHCQSTIILSFNDLKMILQMLQNCTNESQQSINWRNKHLKFLQDANLRRLYDQKSQVVYNGGTYSGEHLFFVYESRLTPLKEVISHYMGVQQPLKDIPLIKDILFHQSNLTVQQSLQIDQDLKLLRRLHTKEIKNYLVKLAAKFRHLHVKDSRELDKKFKESFRVTLGKFLRRKEWLLFYQSQIRSKMFSCEYLMQFYTSELNSLQFYERICSSFIDKIKIKIYLSIKNDLFCVQHDVSELRKLQISHLIIGKDDKKSVSSQQEYLLLNSYKTFQSIKDILRCLSKSRITRAALLRGRHTDEFNHVFQEICNMIVTHIDQFIHKKEILQVLSKEKVAHLVVRKMQDVLYSKNFIEDSKIDADKLLLERSKSIDKELFYKHELQELQIQRQFLVQQGIEKFKLIMSQKSIPDRLRHFSQLFKIILTVLGFSMAKSKISAQIVNPIMQYIILQCPQLPHHECLYSLQCLKWKQTPEENYNLTLYHSSLTYIKDMMSNDYGRKL